LIKERAVPARDIDMVVDRARKFASDPQSHTYREV
jgi:hypothetical protein